MKNLLLKAILQSLGLVLIVSTITATGVGLITQSYSIGIGVFLLSTLIQFFVGRFFNARAAQLQFLNQQTLLTQAAEIKVPIELSCAYCNTINRVPVSLITDNIFKCVNCNQPNTLLIQFTTTRVTQPLSAKVEMKEISMDEEEPNIRQTTINESIKISSNE